MQNYRFDNLNDKEFEVLVNDLVSAREGVTVDRFKPGKDGGVDGRFFSTPDKEIVIQSKHWLKSGVEKLIAHCKKSEAAKVLSLNPSRYIFATSLPLSRSDKKKIQSAFDPYMIRQMDILGSDNINYLLGEHPEIEKKHYKLWLSSTTVLEAMLNSALTGRSEAKRDEIIDKTKLYVLTKNHSLALAKLESLHSVVITGEAGIGKTTLADQLAHHYVGRGFELCVIEDDFSEAEAKLKKKKKQVFYYDDFLGRNYLTAIEGRKDSRVLSFMDRIYKDRDKRFILTSRSTILNQGKTRSDLFLIKNVNSKEYEVTIDSLEILDRAKILYNHIWNSDLPEEYIQQIYAEKRYRKVSKHPNFNPRLIAFITDLDRVGSMQVDKYWEYILGMLDNPKDIWANVYDNQIDELMRIAVCLIVFNGQDLSDHDLRAAVRERALSDRIVTASSAPSDYERMIKAGVGSILRRTISSNEQATKIGLFNPSVADFVLQRHLPDIDAILSFTLCLHTEQSLLNLKSLKDNSSISVDDYYRILRELGRQKVNLRFWSNQSSYFLRLVHMILTDEDAINSCDGPAVRSVLASALELRGFHQHINLLCEILIHANKQEPEVFFELSKKFVRLAAPNITGPVELKSLARLRTSVAAASEETELLDLLRKEAVSFWMEEAHYQIENDGLLADYLYDQEDGEAYIKAKEFISHALSPFIVSNETVLEIVDMIDFDQIKTENREAISHNFYDADDVSDTKGGLEASEIDEAIDDLFYRD